MQHKKLIASIYIKDGEAVDGLRAQNRIADVEALVKRYNDSGIDKLLIFDLSEDEQEHEKNILAIKELNLYLDTHANDQEVLQLYWSYIKLSKEGREKYEKMYGPLTSTDLTPEDGFAWLNDPWPWDVGGND